MFLFLPDWMLRVYIYIYTLYNIYTGDLAAQAHEGLRRAEAARNQGLREQGHLGARGTCRREAAAARGPKRPAVSLASHGMPGFGMLSGTISKPSMWSTAEYDDKTRTRTHTHTHARARAATCDTTSRA